MVVFKQKGNFNKTETFLKKTLAEKYDSILLKYAQMGVKELEKATPVDSGKTASSWYYEIKKSKDGFTIEWKNSNIVKGVNIAIILQYGHGTGTGGYVQGIDYINPAMRPVFDKLSEELWKEVRNN